MNQINFEAASNTVQFGQVRRSEDEWILVIEAENGDGLGTDFNAIHLNGDSIYKTVYHKEQGERAIRLQFPHVVNVEEIKIITREGD